MAAYPWSVILGRDVGQSLDLEGAGGVEDAGQLPVGDAHLKRQASRR